MGKNGRCQFSQAKTSFQYGSHILCMTCHLQILYYTKFISTALIVLLTYKWTRFLFVFNNFFSALRFKFWISYLSSKFNEIHSFSITSFETRGVLPKSTSVLKHSARFPAGINEIFPCTNIIPMGYS